MPDDSDGLLARWVCHVAECVSERLFSGQSLGGSSRQVLTDDAEELEACGQNGLDVLLNIGLNTLDAFGRARDVFEIARQDRDVSELLGNPLSIADLIWVLDHDRDHSADDLLASIVEGGERVAEFIARIGHAGILIRRNAKRGDDTQNFAMPNGQNRSRTRISLALLLVIALGLGSRSGMGWIPTWVEANAGDVLWTVAAYLSLAFLRPGWTSRNLFVSSLAISFVIELSQLSDADWLVSLRGNPVARLFLGSGWQWADLPRYFIGAMLAVLLDRVVLQQRRMR